MRPLPVLMVADLASAPGLSPLVVAMVRHAPVPRRGARPERRELPHWVIDCGEGDGWALRIGAADAPFVARAPGLVHVYAPGTPVWEDGARVREPTLGTYVIFDDQQRRLARLTAAGGFARVRDPGGLLSAALREPFADGATPDRWRCQAALMRLIGILLSARHDSGADWTAGVAAPRLLAPRVDDWLRERLAGRASVAGLARHLGISLSSLAHRYRAETGGTVRDRLMRLRLARAQALLVQGGRLEAVARACGFSDAFHLSKSFRRVIGVPPSRWRSASALDERGC
ncbi:MAG TPA: helix-turn-helix transcriptional regulator [Planctomycetota bacterium]|nr:helix-turn-helix transcriptional regulator [Planctomycetota bacterium]